ncbi:restriction endonuclease subunit S [Staphylococcus aureus]|uniref:restriction endonuclease subunit S n=2 Tax=Staphylococcus aureus TaxID=1280 RepID=UPI00085C1257|nr:restriction endonuclease subunit S [Staphylococcus aureus]MCG5197983.1 restriction endonuclease subunit S [Staphylococcus aureus]WIZ29962.1 restriction endonuclease subunit S [Staphylococcus aureus]SCR33081.1 type I restriction modification DNA specificity domain protein [Staphylococcus aureus]SCR43420.1 type I restriction modification DNA specificity domain protein [Staphylococcus aureus]SCR53834.1 type I restriction modification DNA specificity domain protein [Staphylococcus aureus]
MSNTQTKNVPELRFPGFEGEYSLDIFGNLATNKSDKFNPQNENASIDIELDCIEQNTGRLIKIYNSKEFSSQKNKFNPQNVLYGKLRPYLNKYYFTKKSGVCSSEIWVLKSTKEDKLLNLFLYYFIQTKRYSDVASKSAGSKMPRADWGLIENIRVYFPELCEQQKIGEFFSKLDRQIELEEQKLELLQQQKKGYMQKIFSQELRFKDENGNDYPDWEEKQLGEVAEIIGGGTPSTKNKLYWNGEINWFSPIEIGNKTYVYSSQKKITEEGLRKSSAKILPVGTILFTSRAGIGKTAILAKESTTNQGFQSIVPRKGLLDSYYVYTISNILKILAEKVGAGSTFSEISKKQMEQLNLNIPMIKEQKNISKFFSKFDNLIEIHERKLEFLKQRKQSLLQKMFV